ncbi:MAG TPA: zinc ribbon domain-containing protein [Terriglobales bacterium]|nr:zinc ribbon domain-containing protein [Terriglobales bacterium]
MPLYEYHCAACGADFEHLARRAAAPDPACRCGSAAVERIPYSRVAVAVRSSAPHGCEGGCDGPCAGGFEGGGCGGAGAVN